MQAVIISIGNELLNGRTLNSNATFISKRLQELGIPTRLVLTIRDETTEIQENLRYAAANGDIVLVTGGLGPTPDDITLEALAGYFGKAMVFSETAMAMLVERYRRRGQGVSESNQKLAYTPEGATIIPNPVGSAPGAHIEENGCHFFTMPGVPREMKGMMESYIMPFLQEMPGAEHRIVKLYRTVGIGESLIYESCRELFATRPDFEIAYLPSFGCVDVRISMQEAGDYETFENAFYGKVGEYIYAREDISLEGMVGALLLEKGKTIAVSESCTGGLLQHRLTNLAGSSGYFMGGITTYSNASKMRLLGVREASLIAHGAVSETVAGEMAEGIRKVMGTDIGVSTTGIAGPGGATEEKPVGLIYAGLATAETTIVKKFNFSTIREINKERGSTALLDMIRRYLQGLAI